nr:unnamed protein product [Callosobruchus chinensis]
MPGGFEQHMTLTGEGTAAKGVRGNTVPPSIYDILLQGPTDTAIAQSTETEEYMSEEENIIEESDGDENNDSEMSDDDEENEC